MCHRRTRLLLPPFGMIILITEAERKSIKRTNNQIAGSATKSSWRSWRLPARDLSTNRRLRIVRSVNRKLPSDDAKKNTRCCCRFCLWCPKKLDRGSHGCSSYVRVMTNIEISHLASCCGFRFPPTALLLPTTTTRTRTPTTPERSPRHRECH